MSSNLEHGSTEDLESSASDTFFDCMSRFSVENSAPSVDGSHAMVSSSPDSCFEKSSSFCPERYTTDGLFSDPIFVFGMIQSEKYYQTQNYFLLYAETPRQWRRITELATFDGIQEQSGILGVRALDNFEVNYKILPRVLWNQLNVLLPRLELFNSVTNLTLSFKENESGQIVGGSTVTEISEDFLEVKMSNEDRILNDIEDLGCAQFLESEIIVQSRMSSSCFMVRVESRTCVERKVPFVSSGTQGENGFHTYFNDLKLLNSMRGCTGVAEFVGVVLDDTRLHLRSYLYEYPVLGNILTILICAQSKFEAVFWYIRESWARQIIKAISEIHSKGSLVGGLLWLNDIGIRADGTAVLTGLRTSQRYFQNNSGFMAPELRDVSQTNTNTLGKMVTFRTEIFQLGLILWKLAEHKPNTAGYFCSKSGCTNRPRFMCTADHANPIELPTCNAGIPSYFSDIINQCRLPDPKMRPTACELAKILPRSEDDKPAPAGLKDLLKKYARPPTFQLHCSECGTREMSVHYHCNICSQADFDLCQPCFTQGIHCFDPRHRLMKRIVKDDGVYKESPE